jgi:hypothetical protein
MASYCVPHVDPTVDTTIFGTWSSQDGAVRLEIHPDGRYVLAVAGRHRRTRGTYRSDRLTVLLEADGGLRTTAQFDDDVLELAGHRLARKGARLA